MANIQEHLNTIKNSIYGKEVRGAIHDSIKQCYDDASVEHDNANMEVKLARGVYNTLNDRLEESDKIQKEFSSSLEDIENGMFVSDSSVSSDIEPFNVYSLEFLQNRQNYLLGNFYRKLKKRDKVTICCQGDSLTYGQDNDSSDKRDPLDGHTHCRAGKTYPEALQEYMRYMFGDDKVDVINRGYSGDYVKQGYNRWNTTSSANLTVFMYGTNDSRASWCPYKGDISQFLQWYEKLISREILRNSAVVIVAPPFDVSQDVDIFTFANSLEKLAKKYNALFIKSEDFLRNYGRKVFSDNLHLNTYGYSVFAKNIAVRLSARNIENVTTSSKITTYSNIDNLILKNGAVKFENINYPTPSLEDDTKGLTINLGSGNNGSLFIPFYTEVDDILVYPSLYQTANVNVTYTLDFGLEQPYYSNSNAVEKTKRSKPSSSYNVTLPAQAYTEKITYPNNYIHIAKKGWHILEIKTDSSTFCCYYGLEFGSYENNIFSKTLSYLDNTPIIIDTFTNSWTHNTTAEFRKLSYCYSSRKEIVLVGSITGGTAQQVTTLPEGYRPPYVTSFPVHCRYGITNSIGFISIYPSGAVYFIGETTGLSWVNINGIIKIN